MFPSNLGPKTDVVPGAFPVNPPKPVFVGPNPLKPVVPAVVVVPNPENKLGALDVAVLLNNPNEVPPAPAKELVFVPKRLVAVVVVVPNDEPNNDAVVVVAVPNKLGVVDEPPPNKLGVGVALPNKFVDVVGVENNDGADEAGVLKRLGLLLVIVPNKVGVEEGAAVPNVLPKGGAADVGAPNVLPNVEVDVGVVPKVLPNAGAELTAVVPYEVPNVGAVAPVPGVAKLVPNPDV